MYLNESYSCRTNATQPVNWGETILSSVFPTYKSLVIWKLIQNTLSSYDNLNVLSRFPVALYATMILKM